MTKNTPTQLPGSFTLSPVQAAVRERDLEWATTARQVAASARQGKVWTGGALADLLEALAVIAETRVLPSEQQVVSPPGPSPDLQTRVRTTDREWAIAASQVAGGLEIRTDDLLTELRDVLSQ